MSVGDYVRVPWQGDFLVARVARILQDGTLVLRPVDDARKRTVVVKPSEVIVSVSGEDKWQLAY